MTRVLLLVAILSALCTHLMCAGAPATDPKDAAFIKWFKSKGGIASGVSLATFPGMGRGVLATEDLYNGEQVLFIPNRLLLSRKQLLESKDKLQRRLAEKFPQSEQCVIAALLLEVARGPSSEWKPYLDVLPRYVPNLSHFSPALLDELQAPALKKEATEAQRAIRDNYDVFWSTAKPVWPVPMAVTMAEYTWAASVVDSRGLRFRGEVVLAPFADMFNYASNNIERSSAGGAFFLQHHVLSDTGLSITADRDCDGTGSSASSPVQLFEDYGDNLDNIYITYHGFVPDANPFRCVDLQLPDVLSLKRRNRELVELLQFKRAPGKCISLPTAQQQEVLSQTLAGQSDPKGPPKFSMFNSGMHVYFASMAMNRTELDTCIAAVTNNPNRRSDSAQGKSAYWAAVFDVCGFDRVGKLIDGMVARLPSPNDANGAQAEALNAFKDGISMSTLEGRTVGLIHTFMVNNYHALYGEGPAALLSTQDILDGAVADLEADDEALRRLQAEAAVGVGLNETAMHLELALRYRSNMKRLWQRVMDLFDLTNSGRWKGTPGGSGSSSSKAAEETVAVAEPAAPTADAVASTEVAAGNVTELGALLEQFNDWVAAASPTVMKIKAVELPLPYRVGTIATEDITAEEVYLSVPTSIIIDNEKARTDAVFGPLVVALQDKYKSSDEFHELLLYLLYHKFVLREASFYYPYLRLLPALTQLGSPILWPESAMDERLAPSDVRTIALDERKRTLRTYELVSQIDLITDFFAEQVRRRKLVAGSGSGAAREFEEIFTLDNYLWANSILNSRAIWWGGKRHLIPLLDFINCEEGPVASRVHSTELDPATGKYALTRAGWDVPRGDQLFENYGQPNHIYYLYHGFTLATNSHDCVFLLLELSDAEMKKVDWKVARPIATRLGIRPGQPRATVTVCLKDDPVPETMWLYLALKMDTYQEQFRKRTVGMISVPAAQHLAAMVRTRVAVYSEHSTTHGPSATFLSTELEMLLKVSAKLTQYLEEQGAPLELEGGDVDGDLEDEL